MKNLRIEVYTSQNIEQAQKTITIPLSKLDIALQFLPRETKAILDKEGIDLSQSRKLTQEKGIMGTLIEIENADERIVISAQ